MWKRVFVTVSLLAALLLLSLVRLPGIDNAAFAAVENARRLSLVAIGLRPFVVSFVYIELLSFMIPRCRALRRSGVTGRRKLNKLAILLGMVSALIQAAGICVALDRSASVNGVTIVTNPGFIFFLSSVTILVAGALLTLLLAHAITKWGLGNGFSLIIVVEMFPIVLGNLLELFVIIVVLALLILIFARQRKSVPAFPQGILPVTNTYGVFTMISTLGIVRDMDLAPPIDWLGIALLVPILSAVTFHLFSSRRRLEANLPSGVDVNEYVIARRSLVKSTALLVALAMLFPAGGAYLGFELWFILPILIMMAASGVDVVNELRFRHRHGDKIGSLLEMDNVHCARHAQRVLEIHGFDSMIRAFNYRSLAFFFEPIVKMELLVPASELNRARDIIRPERIEIV